MVKIKSTERQLKNTVKNEDIEVDETFFFDNEEKPSASIEKTKSSKKSILGLDEKKKSKSEFLIEKYREMHKDSDWMLPNDEINNIQGKGRGIAKKVIETNVDGQFLDDTKEIGNEKQTLFGDLGLSHIMQKVIKEQGYVYPTAIQKQAIPAVLGGNDVCGRATTGSGKTAAFLIPISERLLHRNKAIKRTRVLIVLPTRELAVQCHQVAEKLLEPAKVDILLLIGGTLSSKQSKALKMGPDVVIATPGRLADLVSVANIALSQVEILVLDEADRMLDQGFETDLAQIMKYLPKKKQILFFSATISEEIEHLMDELMCKPAKIFVSAVDSLAENLDQVFIRVRDDSQEVKIAMLMSLLEKYYHTRTAVFIQEKHQVHLISNIFKLRGLDVVELHGNMTQVHRLMALEDFSMGKARILLATDVASRGLDIPSIQTVINYTLPKTFIQYQHRIGRTARAGESGCAISLFVEADRKLVKQAIKSSTGKIMQKSISSETLNTYLVQVKQILPIAINIIKDEKNIDSLEATERKLSVAENKIKRETVKIQVKGKKNQKAKLRQMKREQ